MNLPRKLNYYELLGVSSDATLEEITAAYERELSKFTSSSENENIDPIEEKIRTYIAKELEFAYIVLKYSAGKEVYNDYLGENAASVESTLKAKDEAAYTKFTTSLSFGMVDKRKVLEVSRDATDNEIEEAFLTHAYSYHPDLAINASKDEETKELIGKIYTLLKSSYDSLKDEESRLSYLDEERQYFEKRFPRKDRSPKNNQEDASVTSKSPEDTTFNFKGTESQTATQQLEKTAEEVEKEISKKVKTLGENVKGLEQEFLNTVENIEEEIKQATQPVAKKQPEPQEELPKNTQPGKTPSENQNQQTQKKQKLEPEAKQKEEPHQSTFETEKSKTEDPFILIYQTAPKKTPKSKEPGGKRLAKPKTLGETIKDSWQEVREDEKAYPLKERHKDIEKNIHKAHYPANPNVLSEGWYRLKSGLLHVTAEGVHQLIKLSYITKDGPIKFIMRNRINIAATAAAILVASSSQAKSNEKIPVIDEPQTTITDIDKSSFDNPLVNDSKLIFNKDDTSIIADYDPEETIVLNRVHIVGKEETLANLAEESNTPIEYIMEVNDLTDDNVAFGQTINIPYFISKEDLSYYQSSKQYRGNISLREFALQNETDVETLALLNKEAIEVTNRRGEKHYTVQSRTLMVPTFPTSDELTTQKEEAQTYTKSALNGTN